MEDSSDSFSKLNADVSRETLLLFHKYRDLIINEKQSLISKNDQKHIWIRHFHDSLRLSKFIELSNLNIIDIGSGAGLPGIPLALVSNKKNHYYLCENRRKRADFLNTVISKLSIKNAEVIHSRVEQINYPQFDIVLARAVAELNDLFSMSYNIIKKTSTLLFHKGVHIDTELKKATKYWTFDYLLHESKTEKGSYIIEVKNLIKSVT